MAQIIRCDGDGCCKESPDSKGTHVANFWTKVRAATRKPIDDCGGAADLIFCQECWDRLCCVEPILRKFNS